MNPRPFWKNITNWVFLIAIGDMLVMGLMFHLLFPLFGIMALGTALAWPLVLWLERRSREKFVQMTHERQQKAGKMPLWMKLFLVVFALFLLFVLSK